MNGVDRDVLSDVVFRDYAITETVKTNISGEVASTFYVMFFYKTSDL